MALLFYQNINIQISGKIDFNTKTNSGVWADISVGDSIIRCYSVHLKSNQISRKAQEVVDDMENNQKIESKNIKNILSLYKNNVQIRAEQVKIVKKEILSSPYPVIIGADFNDPPISYTYKQFSEKLHDSFKDKGVGLGISYGGVIPFLRIDYLLVSDKLKTLDFSNYNVNYSDHFPILASYKID
ncbi:MAG: hypothetical protein R2771_13470 [Saprospiraceae bacterium]